jgi:hypothetical protein
MASTEFAQRIAKLRTNVFADPILTKRLQNAVRSGEMSEASAVKAIDDHETRLLRGPVLFTPAQIEDEWLALSQMLETSQARGEMSASSRFLIGLIALPLTVIFILASLALGWQNSAGAAVVAALLTASMAAIATHSYLILRVHQQAALAAERLSEKRVGALFLRLATTRDDPAEANRLLEKGTAMFLGHQAAPTVPLQPGDLPRLSDK